MIPLPELNASLNATSTLLLIAGGIAIWRGNKTTHRNLMVSAFIVSGIFLVGYVSNRVLMKGLHTPFEGAGFWRTFYYVMLASHIMLAMSILPLAIRTIWLAIRGEFAKHKFWARITYPIWLYVSVTGVLVYFFLYRWF